MHVLASRVLKVCILWSHALHSELGSLALGRNAPGEINICPLQVRQVIQNTSLGGPSPIVSPLKLIRSLSLNALLVCCAFSGDWFDDNWIREDVQFYLSLWKFKRARDIVVWVAKYNQAHAN